MPKNAKSKLTPQMTKFCEEYIVDFNGTKAAIRAKYSKKSARSKASQLLTNVNVQAEIKRLIKIRADKVGFNAEKLLRILSEDVDADIAGLFDKDGVLLQPYQWPERFRKGLVAGLDITQIFESDEHGNKNQIGIVTKIKLADRTKIKELSGKHVGIGAFKEKLELSTPDGKPLEVGVVMLPPKTGGA